MKKTRTRWLAWLLVGVLLISSLPTAALAVSTEDAGGTPDASAAFSDVGSGDWYYDAVQFVYEHGLMNGTSKTTFSPQRTTTRGMIVTILHRMEGEPSAAAAAFSDVAEASYCCAAVAWASQNGIVTGYDDGTFLPDAPITRQQLAAILYRYVIWKGRSDGAEAAELARFEDAEKVAAYAREAFSWAVGTGIILGTGTNTLSPSGNATRAQVAVILTRLSGWLENGAAPGNPSGSQSSGSGSHSGDSSGSSSGGSSGDSSGGSGGDTASGGAEPENYSIIDVTVDGGAAAFTVYTGDACTLSVRILSDDGKTELHTVSAEADGGLAGGTVRVPLTGIDLPAYYRVEAVLTDSSGAALSNVFASRKYTEAQEKFDALTIHDFPGAQVIDFIAGDSPNENFGVLRENVKTLENIQAVETGDGAYVLPGLTDEQRAALAPGDVLYLPGTGGEPVLVKVGSITTSGESVVIVPDKNVYLADFYQVFKLDIEIPVGDETAEPQEQQARLVYYASQESSAGHTDDNIPEDDEKTTTVRVKANLGTDTVHASAEAEGTSTMRIKGEYDPELFGENYFLFEATVTTEISISLKAEGALGVNEDIELFKGSVNIPNLPGASIYVQLVLPVKLQTKAEMDFSMNVKSVQGVRSTTDTDDPQIIKENTSDGGTFTPKGALELEAGIAVEAGVGILENCVTFGISAGLGAEAELTPDPEAGKEKAPGYHACTLCMDGKKNLFAELKMTGKYHITSFLEGDIVELTVAKITWNVKEFYCSVINEANSIHAGIPATGDGKCPNWKYCLTVETKDSADKTVTDIPVTVQYLYEAEQGPSPFTGNSPYSVYLYNNHTATASATIEDYLVTSGHFAVKNGALTVTLQVPKATVAGVITDKDSGDPLSGVSVKAVDQEDGSTAASATSNASGEYTLKLPVGTFTITAEKSGYQKETLEPISVQAKEELTRNIILAVTGGTVTGTVTDKNTYEPISGAKITLSGADKTTTCTAKTNGTYESEALPAGEYTVTVTAKGYSTYTGTVTVRANQGGTLDVELDGSPATLTGSVVTLDTNKLEQPVSGATVALYDLEEASNTPTVTTTSDADGAFTVEVPVGTYTLKVTADGYAPHSETVTFTAMEEKEISVTLLVGGEFWSFEDGVLTIWGEGPMDDYDVKNTGWTTTPWCVLRLDTKITKVVVLEGVTTVGDYALYWCNHLKEVVLADTVTKIGTSAFGRTGLEKFVVPDTVTELGSQVFSHCESLAEITIPNGVTSMGTYIFSDCTSLKHVVLPDSVETMETGTFYCSGVESVTLPSGLTKLPKQTFAGCTSLSSVTIPETVTVIGDSAFGGCTSLTSINIPKGVTSIGSSAFSGCTGLTSIDIPDGIGDLGDRAFLNCTGLTSVTVPGSLSSYSSFGDYAFSGCTGLTSVTLLDGITRIGESAFKDCTGLTSISIPGSVDMINYSAFRGCTNLTSVTIQDGTRFIYNHAFLDCASLTSVSLPASAKYLYENVFSGCTSLTEISYGGTIEEWNTGTQPNLGRDLTIHCADGDVEYVAPTT